MNNAEQPAFPFYNGNGKFNYQGMNMREYFAGLAMQGLLAQAQNEHPFEGNMENWNYEVLAKCSIKATDELLKQLNQ